MKYKILFKIIPTISMCLFVLGLLFCGTGCSTASKEIVTVGSKNFTEQLILGEIMAQLIETHTGLTVHRRFNLGGTTICHQALERGDIDIYAEYTGTALTAILKQPVLSDPQQVYEIVKEAYQEKFNLLWLDPFGFNNTYTITVRTDFAKKHGLNKIGDLKNIAENLKAGFTAEFSVREDGYPGLRDTYGFEFGQTMDMDPSLMYRAISQEEVDVICAFATDGRIAAYNLTPLEDERSFFPPYYAAPIARQDVILRHPEIRELLNTLSGTIDDQTMQQLNFEVDEQKRDPAVIARDFLSDKGLIP